MNSSESYWIFIAAAAIAYWLLPSRIRTHFLAAAFVGYLFAIRPRAAGGYLLETIAVFGGITAALSRGWRRLPLVIIAALSAGLAWYKFSVALQGLTYEQAGQRWLLHAGLSYLIFKHLHFCIESSRGTLGRPKLKDFVLYTFFLPMFTAGPIERFDHFLGGRSDRPSAQHFAEAGTRIIIGLIKKLLLAEGILRSLADAVDPRPYGAPFHPDLVSNGHLWQFTVLSYLRIYLDFSGYTDIAIGTGQLFGYRLMENFNWPILARTPSDYWRRWHISLTRWCQSYVYMPALGIFRQPFVPLFLVFLVMGLWHSATWNRVGLAAYNSLGIATFLLWSRFAGRPAAGGFRQGLLWRGSSVLLTQVYVCGSVAFIMNGEDQPLRVSLGLLARLAGVSGKP